MIGVRSMLYGAVQASVKEWAQGWDRSIQTNFDSNGRPAWRPTQRGGAVLQKTGRLRRATIVTGQETSEGKFEIIARTNNIPYARMMQYGGVITPKSKQYLAVPCTPEAAKKRPKDFGDKLFVVKKGNSLTLCMKKGRGGKDIVAMYALKKQVRVYGRPFIVVQLEDRELFRAILSNRKLDALG